jgi:hypothetical protein
MHPVDQLLDGPALCARNYESLVLREIQDAQHDGDRPVQRRAPPTFERPHAQAEDTLHVVSLVERQLLTQQYEPHHAGTDRAHQRLDIDLGWPRIRSDVCKCQVRHPVDHRRIITRDGPGPQVRRDHIMGPLPLLAVGDDHHAVAHPGAHQCDQWAVAALHLLQEQRLCRINRRDIDIRAAERTVDRKPGVAAGCAHSR